MTSSINTQEKAHSLSELIDYYEICNKAEGKSPRTITWYTANLRRFRNYLKSRHLPDSVEGVTVQVLREYVLYLMKQDCFSNHPNTPTQERQRLLRRHLLNHDRLWYTQYVKHLRPGG